MSAGLCLVLVSVNGAGVAPNWIARTVGRQKKLPMVSMQPPAQLAVGHSLKLEQTPELLTKPLSQLHVYEPFVFVQVEWGPHGNDKHSSMSLQVTPESVVVNPDWHAHTNEVAVLVQFANGLQL